MFYLQNLDFFLYENKIHPLTNYKAIKNKSNKTRQYSTQNLDIHCLM